MILICNREYQITISLQRPKTASEKRKTATVIMNYCGGSCCDKNGHHIGGGVWVDRKGKQWFDLNILNITNIATEWERETKPDTWESDLETWEEHYLQEAKRRRIELENKKAEDEAYRAYTLAQDENWKP